jgi:hypothetical protein
VDGAADGSKSDFPPRPKRNERDDREDRHGGKQNRDTPAKPSQFSV